MADIVITATSVLGSGGVKIVDKVLGAAVSAGEMVYDDVATGTVKLADNDSATAAVRSPLGMALNGGAIGQPVKVAKSGPVTVGAVLTAGVAYYLSATPGKICPVADLSAGKYPTIVGIARSTSILDIKIHESGVAL